MPITLSVQSRSGKEVVKGGIPVPEEATVHDLQVKFHQLKPKFYPSRQRFSLPLKAGEKKATSLAHGKKLSDYDLKDGSVLIFKDLGPQIGYSTVFFWEYFGPLVVYALFYFFPSVFYPTFKNIPDKHPVQTMAVAYWSFHYTKRIFETFFVHRFSHGTMPLTNLFKNCGYYWGFAAFVSYFVNHPLHTTPSTQVAYVLFGLAMLCQVANLTTHVIQRNLRPPGGKGYAIPHGFGFDYITCANYTFEIYGWILFAAATWTLPALIFITAGAAQMAIWAKAKHARLRKIFDGKDGRDMYPKRWIMLPPFF
ncbi:g2136 [Coccomyxa elongata]